MTQQQSAALSQLAYLDKPPGVDTLSGLVNYYNKNPGKIPAKNDDEREFYINTLKYAASDPYLKNLKIVGYQNNNDTTGFVGYAFEYTTSATPSKDGVVSFRGSEDPSKGNINDWINNLIMETNPSSPHMKDATAFMKNTANGAGSLKSIQTVGHSLGGFHAGTQAILDPRVTSATTYNAPGVPDSFKLKYSSLMTKENLSKIDAYVTTGDLVSKFGSQLVKPTKLPGSFDIDVAHSMATIMEGLKNMDDIGVLELLQEALPFALAGVANNITSLMDKFGLMWDVLTTVFPGLEEVTDRVWAGINILFTETIPNALEWLTERFVEFGVFLAELWSIATQCFSVCWNAISVFFTETIPEAVQSLTDRFTEFGAFLTELWNGVTQFFTECWDAVVVFFTETVPGAVQSVTDRFIEFGEFLTEFWVQVSEAFNTCWNAIVLFFTETIPNATRWVFGRFSEFGTSLSGIWNTVSQAFSSCWDAIAAVFTETLPEVIDNALNIIGELPEKMLSIGTDIVRGIWEGISASGGWLWDQVKGFCGGIADGICNFFGINSPSKLMRDTVGIGIAEGIAVGITDNIDLVSDAMRDMADAVADTDISIEPEVNTNSLSFESFKQKLRPSLDFVKSQLALVQDVMASQISASAQLAVAKENAAMNSIYNNGHTYNNSYTIQSNGNSPKATADAIKNQQTLTRMLFA